MKPSNLKIENVVFVADTKPITQTVRINAEVFGKLAGFIGLEHQESGKWQRGSSEAVSKVIDAIVKDLEAKGSVNLSTIIETAQAEIAPATPAPAKAQAENTSKADTSKAPISASIKNKA